VCPLEKHAAQGGRPCGAAYVPPKRAPRRLSPPRPGLPRCYRLVDALAPGLGEDVDNRRDHPRGPGSVVDVRIYVWDDRTEHWSSHAGEQKRYWAYRGSSAPESASR